MVADDRNNVFDRKLWNHLMKGLSGLIPSPSPKEKGAYSALELVIAYEALNSTCINNGLIFSTIAHGVACVMPLAIYGTEAQKKKYLNKLASGKSIAANAITESTSGSDVFNMSTTAVKKGNSYILNGEKKYITNAPICNYILVYVLTDKTKGFFGGVSCFLVDSKTKGIKISKAKDKMGLRTAQMGDITFKNVRVNEDCMIGKPGAGAQIFNHSMLWERVAVSAMLCGQLQRVLKDTIAYAKKRKISTAGSGTGFLADIPLVKQQLEDTGAIVNDIKDLIFDAAYTLDTEPKATMAKCSQAKLFASENTVNCIKQLQELYGAKGYLSETGIEREYRDAFASLIYSGTSAVQRNIIGNL
jgi:alkylation response protein AidB-like acyl-CoA dehydrogenase